MRYEKPEIIVLASAADAIQARKSGSRPDSDCGSSGTDHTNCAYQSDE